MLKDNSGACHANPHAIFHCYCVSNSTLGDSNAARTKCCWCGQEKPNNHGPHKADKNYNDFRYSASRGYEG
jgi:hypothetical protein